MYPEQNYAPYPPAKNNRKLKLLMIGAALIVLIIVLAISLWPKETFPQHKLSKTSLQATQEFGYLRGTDIYAFNGMAFYKLNLNDTSKPTILSSGMKLPEPNNVYWANSRGALMTFKESFILSQVETELQARGEQLTPSTEAYAWYLDFASRSLKLVSKLPITPNLAYYSEKDGGFYYMTGGNEDPNATPLYFYDIASGQNQTISNDLAVVDITGLRQCSGAERLCFIARDRSNTATEKIYGIDGTGQKKVVLDSPGRLFATNNPDFYIAVGRGEDLSHGTPGEHDEVQVDYGPEPAILHNISAKTSTPLGFDVSGSDIIAHFSQNGEFYVLDSNLTEASEGKQNVSYRSGRLSDQKASSDVYPMTYADGTAFTSAIIDITSHNGNQSLLTLLDGSQAVFTAQPNVPAIISKSQTEVQKTIDSCLGSGRQESQFFPETRQFRVYFVENTNLATDIAAFSNCMAQSDPSTLIGYNFRFATRDPINGRITSN